MLLKIFCWLSWRNHWLYSSLVLEQIEMIREIVCIYNKCLLLSRHVVLSGHITCSFELNCQPEPWNSIIFILYDCSHPETVVCFLCPCSASPLTYPAVNRYSSSSLSSQASNEVSNITGQSESSDEVFNMQVRGSPHYRLMDMDPCSGLLTLRFNALPRVSTTVYYWIVHLWICVITTYVIKSVLLWSFELSVSLLTQPSPSTSSLSSNQSGSTHVNNSAPSSNRGKGRRRHKLH